MGKRYEGDVKPGGGELCSGGVVVDALHGAELLLRQVESVDLDECSHEQRTPVTCKTAVDG